MTGFLRRLRGGIAGVVLAVDVETERERQRLRQRQLGTSDVAMPPMTTHRLRGLLRARIAELDIPHLAPEHERRLLRAARGRPGWIVRCAQLLAHRRYWRHGTLYVSVLCTDTEIALRQGALRLLPHDVAEGERNINREQREASCPSVR
jgi:hypothetical protein